MLSHQGTAYKGNGKAISRKEHQHDSGLLLHAEKGQYSTSSKEGKLKLKEKRNIIKRTFLYTYWPLY